MKFYNIILNQKTFTSLLVFLVTTISMYAANWGSTSVFPAGKTDGMFNFVINGKAYVGSGLAGTHFYEFDPSSGIWKDMGTLPGNIYRIWALAFAYNGKGYVGGGSIGEASSLTDTFYEYDPVTNTWTQKASFGGGKRDASMSFVIGNKGYVGGGYDGANIVADFWEYDFSADKWSQIGYLPFGAAIFPSGFAMGSKGYLIGGQGVVEHKEVFEFDPYSKAWTKKADFPGKARQAGCAFVMGNHAYFGGGMTMYSETFSDFWEYNPTADSWRQLEKEVPTTYTAWATSFVIGSTAYFGGGASFDGGTLNFSDAFYTVSGLSTGIEEDGLIPYPRAILRSVAGGLVIQTENPSLNRIEIFDIIGNQILSKSLTMGEQYIPLEKLSSGIFTYRLRSDKEKGESGLFFW